MKENKKIMVKQQVFTATGHTNPLEFRPEETETEILAVEGTIGSTKLYHMINISAEKSLHYQL